MESITIDETLLTGSEGAAQYVDEMTLAATPAPVAVSTVMKGSYTSRSRALRDNGGSFLNSKSLIIGEVDSDESINDRSSLGLLPSNCLLEIENDLLREGSICLMKNTVSADTHSAVSLSSVNTSRKNQLMDSQSSREYTSDTNEILTTVKKCPEAGAPERNAGRYVPQALFQSVKEVDESRLNNSSASQRDPKMQPGEKWDSTETQKNSDSGMGQATLTGSRTSNGSGAVLSGLGAHNSNSSGGDPRKQCTEMWESNETHKNSDSGMGQATLTGSRTSNGSGAVMSVLGAHNSNSSGGDPRKQCTEMWESNETQKSGDSGMGQATFTGSQVSNVIGAVFSALGIQVRRSAGGDNCVAEELNEDDDADQSVYQTKFDPEDLEKLENSFSDFVDSSDEDGVAEEVEFRIVTGPKDDGSVQPKNLVPRMDGPFKIPLPLATPSKLPNKMYFGNQPSALTATPCKEPELQATFGDASHVFLSGSTSEWGPSIDFGSSIRFGEASHLDKDSHILDEEKRKYTFTRDPAEPQVSSFGVLPVDGGSRMSENPFGDFPKGATSEVFASSGHPFGDVPIGKNKSTEQIFHNPFGNFSGDVTGEGFGDEDFMLDADAAAAMLAEDEKLFKNDHLCGNDVLNLTQASGRGADQTFMNMTIGTYMASGSGELGSLNSHNKRPDIGMPAVSPPTVRSSGPLLSPDKIFRSPDGNNKTQQITDGGDGCFRNALFSLDSTDSCVALETSPPKKSLVGGTQEASLPCDFSSFPVADSQKQMLNDCAKTSFVVESSSALQAPVDPCPVTYSQSSTKGLRTGELKSAHASEQHLQVLSAAAIFQKPPKSSDPGETDHNQTLIQAEMSLSRLGDETQDFTSHQVTFSNIYNLVEGPDTSLSLSNLGGLFLSEYSKKVKEKQAAKQSQQKTDTKSAGKVQKVEKPTARPITHLHDIAKTSSTALVTSQRQGELETQPSKNITNTTESFGKMYADINKDSTSVLSVSQSSKDHHQKLERQQLLAASSASKPQIHSSQSKIDNKLENNIDAGTTSVTVKKVIQEGCSRLPESAPQQLTTSAQFLKPSEANVSHKRILPEKIDGQQRNLTKGPSTKTAHLGHQMTLPSVSEECTADDSSLESIPIGSTYSEIARSTKPIVQLPKTLPVRTSFLQEKINTLRVVKPQETRPSIDNLHLLLNATANTTAYGDVSNMTQFHTFMHDSSRSLLENTEVQNKLYVCSTPCNANRSGRQKFANITEISEKSILPIVTPQTVLDILEVPECVCMPEVCCVNLSLQTSFVVRNLLNKGVRCLFTIREVTFDGHRISSHHCPFELKGQVVLSSSSTQNVQVMFKPKNQGEYTANVEICSQNMTNPQENRTYILYLSGCSEEPALQISAVDDVIDFGEMIWGSSSCRSINIKNVGRATIPLRCSIFRKESALCNFTFQSENVMDVSSISLTNRPANLGAVHSLSLPGKKEGQKILMETINIYCSAKESQNLALRYMETAEKFHAQLIICVDVPIEGVLPLCKVKLQATAGMYKLHVNQDTLPIAAAPGKTGHGTVQIINSGNISMPVSISLEPWRDHFTISTTNVVVPSGGNCPIHVTFTPQAGREEQGDSIVNLMLQNKLSKSYVSLIGKIKSAKTCFRCSVTAVDFLGVDVGKKQKQKVTFYIDNDDCVTVCIRNQGTAFKLLSDNGHFVDSFEVSAKKGHKYEVFVLFSPSEVKGYSALLTLQVLYANRYSIPLSGYGGRSQVLIEKVHQNNLGDLSTDIGHVQPEQTVFRKFTVRNIGSRACYIMASLRDASAQAFESSRARVIPAAVIVSANEASEFVMTMNASKKEADMCMSKRAVVAILRLAWGDEVARQHFILDPGQQSPQLVHDFDIPLSTTQKELVHSEMRGLHPPENSYSALKKGMTVSKVGLYGVPLPTQTTAARADPYVNRPASITRPVLTPVNANIKPTDSNKKTWQLNPTEIHFTGGELKVKDFIQVINFSTNEIQFSVEFDKKYLTVVPSKGIVPPQNTLLLDVSVNPTSFSTKEPTTYLTTIKVNCLQQTQLVKVNITGHPDKPSPRPAADRVTSLSTPTTDRVTSLSTPAAKAATTTVQINRAASLDSDEGNTPRQHSGKVPAHNPAVPMGVQEGHSERIQGLDVATVGTIQAGARKDDEYFFTNVSSEPLTWKLAPFAAPYVTLPDDPHSLFRVDHEVFQLSPMGGVLQPYEQEKVHIKFSPQCEGSYNQGWCVCDTADSQDSFHRFTIYAKASSSSSRDRRPGELGTIPQGLSATHFSKSPRGKHMQKSLSFSRLSPPTRINSSEGSKSHGTGSSVVHSSKVEKRIVRHGVHHSDSSGVHRSSNTGVSPALITRSTSAVQRPTPALSPGVSWMPVNDSREESYRLSPVTSHTSSRGAVNSRATSGRIVGSSRVTKDTEASLVTSDSLNSLAVQESNSSRDGSPFRGENGTQLTPFNLERTIIKFPQLCSGESSIVKITVRNSSDEEYQVVVERAPKPPFVIKHDSFKLRKNMMVKFPVYFKPKHVARFEDVVIFKDTRTGNTVTATLLAECVNTLADTQP